MIATKPREIDAANAYFVDSTALNMAVPTILIPANKNPSLIGITVYIVLERETGVGIAISSLSIDQKGTK